MAFNNINHHLSTPIPQIATKLYWDDVFQQELHNFEEFGDAGEVWFGDSSVKRIMNWILKTFPISSSGAIHFLDIGCGNGNLVFALLDSGYSCVTGLDYSPAAISFCSHIADCRTSTAPRPTLHVHDICAYAPDTDMCEAFDCALDKGTFDVVSLILDASHATAASFSTAATCSTETSSTPLADASREEALLGVPDSHAVRAYVGNVWRSLRPGGRLLVASCNWTQEELIECFCERELLGSRRFLHVDTLPAPRSFQFGGRTGQTLTSIILQRI